MNIYDLKLEQQKLLEEIDGCDTPEELDEIAKLLEDVASTAKGKINFVSTLLLEAKAQADLAKEAKKIAVERLDRQLRRKERTEQLLEDYIVNAMFAMDIKKIECDLCNITRSLTPGKVMLLPNFDSSKIPSDCIEIVPAHVKPLLAQLARHLRSGEEIEGVELRKEQTIRIS